MVDDQLEECVHEEDAVRQDAAAVQQHRLWGDRGRVRVWVSIKAFTKWSAVIGRNIALEQLYYYLLILVIVTKITKL